MFNLSPTYSPRKSSNHKITNNHVSPDKNTQKTYTNIKHKIVKESVLVFIFYCFCPFLFYTFLNSGIDKFMNGPWFQHVLALCAFFNRGDTQGTNSPKILCVDVYVNLCQDWFCGFWLICGLMTGMQSK